MTTTNLTDTQNAHRAHTLRKIRALVWKPSASGIFLVARFLNEHITKRLVELVEDLDGVAFVSVAHDFDGGGDEWRVDFTIDCPGDFYLMTGEQW